MSTIVRQERHVEYVGPNTQKFVITSSLAWGDIGSFPHPFVFVYTINDRFDPKADTFARITTLADLTTLPKGRDAALAASTGVGVEYLTTAATVSYADLATAVTAEKAFKDRLSQLVSDWTTYSGTFVATPTAEAVTLPLVSATTKAALIAAYRTAKQNRYSLQVAAQAAQDAQTAAQAKHDELAADVTTLQTQSAALAAAHSALSNARVDLAALEAATSAFVGTTSEDKTAILAALATAAADEATIAQRISEANDAANAASSALSAKQSALATSTTALTTAVTAYTVAQQQLADAQTTETAALNAVLAVCPDFDSTTICNVAG